MDRWTAGHGWMWMDSSVLACSISKGVRQRWGFVWVDVTKFM